MDAWQQHEARLVAAIDLEAAAIRLRTSVAHLAGNAAAESDRFGVAVSGGADSLALLFLAKAAFGDRIAAATVDHRLRPDSIDEARFVGKICSEHGIAHSILTPSQPITGTVQANARAARYALLEAWCNAERLDWLMTAHHADDQLETLVMRANRASGVGGMAGIRARQRRLLRPLLDWRREELAALVASQSVCPIDDPSNRDDRFDRARIRPAVQACTLIDPLAANAVAGHLAEADEALDWTVDQLAPDRLLHQDERLILNVKDLPAELLRRLVVRAWLIVSSHDNPPRGQQVSGALQALASGQQVMLGSVLIRPDRNDGTRWHFRLAPPRRPL